MVQKEKKKKTQYLYKLIKLKIFNFSSHKIFKSVSALVLKWH